MFSNVKKSIELPCGFDFRPFLKNPKALHAALQKNIAVARAKDLKSSKSLINDLDAMYAEFCIFFFFFP